MQEAVDLHELAAKVRAAQRHVETARTAVATDKQERAGSLRARLVDALTTTQPEAALADAEAGLAAATKKGKEAARAWIIGTARQSLAQKNAESAQHQEQAQKLERVKSRAAQVRRWLKLAREADSHLSAARSACSSASTTELLDFVSTNKAVSALSYMDTSSAADAVKSAGRAVQALAEALPKRAEHAEICEPDDLLDLVVDLAFDPGFDVLSLFNMSRLDDAARQCGQAANKLRPLLERLRKLADDAQAKADQERAALRGIKAPYLRDAEVAGSNPVTPLSGRGSVPGTSVTDYSGHMGNTCAWNGLGAHSTRPDS